MLNSVPGDSGCGVLPVGGTSAGSNSMLYTHTHTATIRNLVLLVGRLLIYLIFRLVCY